MSPDQESRSLPPLKHSIFPSLGEFHFTRVTKYLEELSLMMTQRVTTSLLTSRLSLLAQVI